jgi:hypothetical protein
MLRVFNVRRGKEEKLNQKITNVDEGKASKNFEESFDFDDLIK